VTQTSQKRAIQNYRSRLKKRGVARFEVLGLNADRELIRSVARRLAQDDSGGLRIRAELRRTISEKPGERGGILAALRRSPLVGADLNLVRTPEGGRDIDL
jgi:hypothetical protein